MMMWVTVWLLCAFFQRFGMFIDPEWHLLHQKDYAVKMERANVVSFNSSYFDRNKLEFAPYNRTQRAINANINLLVDLTTNLIMTAQAYKFMSNEYRFFPLTYNLNICTEYKQNSFGVGDMLRKSSNIPFCPIKKRYYYILNGLPDFSKLPPFIPRGRYKSNIKFFNKIDFLSEIDLYMEIIDKTR